MNPERRFFERPSNKVEKNLKKLDDISLDEGQWKEGEVIEEGVYEVFEN